MQDKQKRDNHLKKHNNDINALKKAIEDLREGGGAIHTSFGAVTTRVTRADPSGPPKKLRIGGWSPYGAPPGSRLPAAEASDLQKNISTFFTKEQKREWRWGNHG